MASSTKKKTIKDLAYDTNLMSERILKLERMVVSFNINEITEKLDNNEVTIKVYEKKIKDLNEIVNNSQNNKHSPTFKCKLCDQTFSKSFKMEEHLKTHTNADVVNCSICDKEFVVKWRLDKHFKTHSENNKYCHYFNNGKSCPYENIGCKFKHEDAPLCRYLSRCRLKVCQFQHSIVEDMVEEVIGSDSDNEDVNSNYEDEDSLTDYEVTDYDKVDENDLGNSMYSDCGACSKVLTIHNSYKCKLCGEPKHRSNCNKWFDTVRKHHYCGGCVYSFEPKKNAL